VVELPLSASTVWVAAYAAGANTSAVTNAKLNSINMATAVLLALSLAIIFPASLPKTSVRVRESVRRKVELNADLAVCSTSRLIRYQTTPLLPPVG
jgi:hypothetical protein